MSLLLLFAGKGSRKIIISSVTLLGELDLNMSLSGRQDATISLAGRDDLTSNLQGELDPDQTLRGNMIDVDLRGQV